MKSHEWPRPMYRDGKVYYAASQSDWNLHALSDASDNHTGVEPFAGYGWSGQYVHQEFPKALHGPDGQSISVKDKKALDTALKNGWSLKPVDQPAVDALDEVPTHHTKPKPAKKVKKVAKPEAEAE